MKYEKQEDKDYCYECGVSLFNDPNRVIVNEGDEEFERHYCAPCYDKLRKDDWPSR